MGQAALNFDELTAQLEAPTIVGATLDDCFRNAPALAGTTLQTQSTGSGTTPAANVVGAPKKVEGGGIFGVRFQVEAQESSAKQDPPSTSQAKACRKKGAKPPTPKKEHLVKPTITKAAGGKAEGRGRPTHDNKIIGMEQIRTFGNTTETDITFYGEGYKNHKQFLQRVKTNIESRMGSSNERSFIKHRRR